MSYIYNNPNPCNKLVGDCVIRGLAIAENKKWQDIYVDLCLHGLTMCDMPSSNSVWKSYLQKKGYEQYPIVRNTTVREFADSHRYGVYVLCTGSHVVTAIDGDYYDTWDSGEETPVFYMQRR